MNKELEVFPVNIQNLYRLEGILPFAIYVRLINGQIQRVLGPKAKLDASLVDDYIMQGLKEFYVLESDRHALLTTLDQQVVKKQSERPIDLPTLKGLVDELSTQTLKEVYATGNMTPAHLEQSKHVVETYVALSLEQAGNLPVFLELAKSKGFYLRHSMMTAIFSILLARTIFGEARDTLTQAGLAGLLHDVGMARLPEQIFEFDKSLSHSQMQVLTQHPALGVDIVKNLSNIPQDVVDAILQHHEAWDGSGYPSGLRGADINHLARIVAVADYFGSMITQWGNHMALTPQLAGLMLDRNTQLDPQLVMAFKTLLNLG